MQQDLLNDNDAADTLDGSAAAVNRFIAELVYLAGQCGEITPVLELQFGDIVTRTSVETSGKDYLLITALLPRCDQSYCSLLSGLQEPEAVAAIGKIEVLWHAEEGRYIAVRKVPVAALSDERAVMDAILTTSDEAGAWFHRSMPTAAFSK